MLEVEMLVEGGPVRDSVQRIGKFKIHQASTDQQTALTFMPTKPQRELALLHPGLVRGNRTSPALPVTLYFAASNRGARSIRELHGQFEIMSGDSSTVEFHKPQANSALNDPRLREAGISLSLVGPLPAGSGKGLFPVAELHVRGKTERFLGAEFVDNNSRSLHKFASAVPEISRRDQGKLLVQSIKLKNNTLPADTRLLVKVASSARHHRVPFAFRDIPLP
jgi:hypothetical protein